MVLRESFYDVVVYGVASHRPSRATSFHSGKWRVKCGRGRGERHSDGLQAGIKKTKKRLSTPELCRCT